MSVVSVEIPSDVWQCIFAALEPTDLPRYPLPVRKDFADFIFSFYSG